MTYRTWLFRNYDLDNYILQGVYNNVKEVAETLKCSIYDVNVTEFGRVKIRQEKSNHSKN